MPRWIDNLWIAVAAAATLLASGAVANEKKLDATGKDAVVYTRAEVRSYFVESNGKLYIRLKLLPGYKIPFSTQAFLVSDRSLLSGIGEGATVEFTAKRLSGENTLTSIRVVEPCIRFRRCD